jgi:4-alpha-glucanotransferase
LPPELPGLLADWGLLRSAVTRFEREAAGRYRPARTYPAHALASLGTHDLPPLPGFLDGTDLALRRRAGAIASDALLAAARAERESEVRAFRARLAEEGLLADASHATPDEISVAAHAFLAGTSSRLVAASLDDLAGEHEPVNLPGVAPGQHPSWSRRMAQPLAMLFRSPELAGRLAPLRGRMPRGGALGGR